MMKSAEDRPCGKLAEPLDWTMGRRIFVQGQVRSEFVVVGGIGVEDPAQMVLAQDHDVIQALPTDRADQPLRMSVLPGRAGRHWVIPDPHRRKTSPDGLAVASIAVTNEMGRRLVPWEGLGDLLCDPFRRRMDRSRSVRSGVAAHGAG